jgi:hypothetical protein
VGKPAPTGALQEFFPFLRHKERYLVFIIPHQRFIDEDHVWTQMLDFPQAIPVARFAHPVGMYFPKDQAIGHSRGGRTTSSLS